MVELVGKHEVVFRAERGERRNVRAEAARVRDRVLDTEKRGETLLERDVQLGGPVQKTDAARGRPVPVKSVFGRGEGFMNIVWPSGYKYSMNPQTGPATHGKIAATVMPADKLADGSLLYAGLFCWGYGYAVSKYSANPELAYAYAQWMTSPTISADAIPYLGGYSDPYRVNHMKEPTPRLVETYGLPYLDTLYNNIVNTVPDFCLPGGFEYHLR